MPTAEQRSLADRRRQPRGGRRSHDESGQTPLVLVVGGASSAGRASEAVLAKLRFAVAISDTVDQALDVITTLQPDVVVVSREDLPRIRNMRPDQRRVLVMRGDPELLVDAIRRSLA